MHKLIFQSVRGCTSSSKTNNEMLSSYKVDFVEVLADLVTHSVVFLATRYISVQNSVFSQNAKATSSIMNI